MTFFRQKEEGDEFIKQGVEIPGKIKKGMFKPGIVLYRM